MNKTTLNLKEAVSFMMKGFEPTSGEQGMRMASEDALKAWTGVLHFVKVTGYGKQDEDEPTFNVDDRSVDAFEWYFNRFVDKTEWPYKTYDEFVRSLSEEQKVAMGFTVPNDDPRRKEYVRRYRCLALAGYWRRVQREKVKTATFVLPAIILSV